VPRAALQAAEPPVAIWPQVDQPREVAAPEAPKLGTSDFSIAVWARADAADRVTGDLVSQYDARKRRGFHLTLKRRSIGFKRHFPVFCSHESRGLLGLHTEHPGTMSDLVPCVEFGIVAGIGLPHFPDDL
jgi:hypothetical protein